MFIGRKGRWGNRCDFAIRQPSEKGKIIQVHKAMFLKRAAQLPTWVVVSNMFYFHPYLGKIPNLTNMFLRGWNHQLATYRYSFFVCFFCLGVVFEIKYLNVPWPRGSVTLIVFVKPIRSDDHQVDVFFWRWSPTRYPMVKIYGTVPKR